MKFISGVLINAVLFIAIAGFTQSFHVASIWVALGASFVLAVLNVLLKPILLILTLPINFLTLGLFTFIINAFLLQLTSKIIGGDVFAIASFSVAILIAIVMTLVNMIVGSALKKQG
ncbi:phage holin family protein [Brochothrix campestris]|uniref:Putative integral inner membrane protein n=1 Tax=Brochothrix campestris FSL F6-1037 TaxID=1265861 RepID=W7D407_9LIST|nr:phage holin family protein [Brochothrix campestris]EUJ40008.1 putative integral inner membrane protein [Brochothrix campestris FSL F6-1037]